MDLPPFPLKRLLFFLFSIFSNALFSASGGPDAAGYAWKDQAEADGPEFFYLEPRASAVTVLSANTSSATLTLARPWGGIYGTAVSELVVSRFGFISLDSGDPGNDGSSDCLPAIPSSADDDFTRLYVAHKTYPSASSASAKIAYEYLPNCPHPHYAGGVHVITWQGFNDGSSNPLTDYQVLLFDNFDILIQAKVAPAGTGYTVGIQNADASTGLNVRCSGSAYQLAAESAVLITPPAVTVTTVEDELDTPSGPEVSLREAIRDAGDGSRIEIGDLSSAIMTLDPSRGRLDLDERVLAIEVDDFTRQRQMISGGGVTQHFDLSSECWLSLAGLRFVDGFGDGLAGGSFRVEDATVIAHSCSWEDNKTLVGGGAVQINPEGQLYLTRCDFFRNESGLNGGAIAADSGSLATFECRFWRNEAGMAASETDPDDGGAIWHFDSELSLDFTEFAFNETTGAGGAIQGDNLQSEVRLFGCTFDDNRAVSGGAIAILHLDSPASRASFHAERCTFYRNSAAERGGAIHEVAIAPENGTGTVAEDYTFLHCSFIENTAGFQAGAIMLENADVSMQACLLANNTAGNFDDQLASSGSGQLDGSAGANYSTNQEGIFDIFDGANHQEVSYLPLGYYGGFVRTAPLLADSAGIDVVQPLASVATTDARGVALGRDIGGGMGLNDVGAVELGPVVTVTTEDETGAGSIREAFDLVEDGGVIRFDGPRRIAMSQRFNFAISSNDTRAILLDGSSSGGVVFENASLTSSLSLQVAFHHLKFAQSRSWSSGSVSAFGELGSHTLNFSDCRFSGFRGVKFFTIPARTQAAFTRCQLEHMQVIGNGASVLAMSQSPTAPSLFLRDVLLQNNHCETVGADSARLMSLNAMTFLQRCSIVANRGDYDEGAPTGSFISVDSNGTQRRPWTFVENTTFSGNVCDYENANRAGFFFSFRNFQSFGVSPTVFSKAEFNHCTFADNELPITGSLFSFTDTSDSNGLSFQNTIFQNQGKPILYSQSGDVIALSGNLSDGEVSFFGPGDRSQVEPLLSPLVMGTNGTLHHYPRMGSPCLESAFVRNGAGRDGRGSMRRISQDPALGVLPLADVGAVESGRIFIVDTSVDEENGVSGGVGTSLREVVAEARNNGPVQVNYDPSVHDQEHVFAASLRMEDNQVDIDGFDTGISLVSQIPDGAEEEVFRGSESSVLSLSGLRLVDLRGMVAARDDSVATLSHCVLTGESDISLLANRNSQLRVANSHVTELSYTGRGLQAIGEGHLEVYRSAVTRCSTPTTSGYDPLVDIPNRATGCLVESTFAHNRADEITATRNDGQLFLDRTTIARNGNGPESEDDSVLYVRDSIITNNFGSTAFVGSGSIQSLGGNLSEKDDPNWVLTPPSIGSLIDTACRATFLAPLADYTNDELPEMPPLAASPAFNQRIGAAAPPSEVLVVTTHLDEDDAPAGDSLSLREAIRDIAPRGTIIFDRSLNGSDIVGSAASPTLEVDVSLTIDGTSLPQGIDLVNERLLSTSGGVTLSLHGLHLRDFTSSFPSAGLVGVSAGQLNASQCSFTGGTLTNPSGLGSALYLFDSQAVIENCTFAKCLGLKSPLYLKDSFVRMSLCTIAENRDEDGVISVIGDESELRLYGCVFSDNVSPVSVYTSDGGLFTSIGFNGFPDTPSLSLASSDETNVAELANGSAYPLLNELHGFAANYPSIVGMAGREKIPLGGLGDLPLPLIDGRGYPRTIGFGTEWGAVESGAAFTDVDGDAIPDYWENYYGLNSKSSSDAGADPDGDGDNNLTEFNNATDPNFVELSAPALITGVKVVVDLRDGGSNLQITWVGDSGQFYQFECSDDLIIWEDVTPEGLIEANGSEQTSQFRILATPRKYFYRLYPTSELPD